MRGRLHAVAALLVTSCTGCSINGLGLASVDRFETDTAHVVVVKAWGGHLSTQSIDRGWTLGWSRRVYLHPKTASRSRTPGRPGPAGNDPGARLRASGASGDVLPAIGTVVDVAGLSLDANSLRTGMHLGLRSSAALRLPLGFEGTVLLRYDSEDLQTLELEITGGEP